MRILIHDYGGYPFPAQLSRALARRGHTLLHLFCGSVQTPHGAIVKTADDPETFSIGSIELGSQIQKYSYVRRWFQERAYGKLLAARIADFGPDVVISANTPLDVQVIIQAVCRRSGSRFVFWLQDLISVATSLILRKKIPVLGRVIGHHYGLMERRLLRRSDHIIAISPDFFPRLEAWGILPDRITCIPNWAPVEELALRPKNNAWSIRHGVADRLCLLYSGTLGMKHNPQLLLSLARHVNSENADVIVASEGPGADWLKREAERQGVRNLRVLGFQPYGQLSDMLGAADVLVAILEPEAAVFSVPSKVLTYLCAKRSLLLAIPAENLAARTVEKSRAGIAVDPRDEEGFVRGALQLLRNADIRETFAANARAYALETFGIDTIAGEFELVLKKAKGGTA